MKKGISVILIMLLVVNLVGCSSNNTDNSVQDANMIEKLNNDIAKLQSDNEKLQQDFDKLKETNEKNLAEIDKLKEENNQQLKEYDEKNQEISKLTEENTKLKEQLQNGITENNDDQNDIEKDNVNNQSDEDLKWKRLEKGGVYVGGIVPFGCYEQDNNTKTKERIEWIIMDIDKSTGYALFLSKYILDCRQYNNKKTAITWEKSSLRKWLNETFYNEAFDDDLKKYIVNAKIENNTNPETNKAVDAGNNTLDKVFILSYEDMINYSKYGYSTDYNEKDLKRRCSATKYALERADGKMLSNNYKTEEGKISRSYFLRTPGFDSDYVCYVNYSGKVECTVGTYVENGRMGVRPAIYLNLNLIYKDFEDDYKNKE